MEKTFWVGRREAWACPELAELRGKPQVDLSVREVLSQGQTLVGYAGAWRAASLLAEASSDAGGPPLPKPADPCGFFPPHH